MENRSNRTSEELAEAKSKLYGFTLSSRPARNSPNETLDDPAIEIGFEGDIDVFQPGDFLKCEYTVTHRTEHDIQAIETSVIWLTEGKGDSDIGVHFFERRPRQALTNETFNQTQRIGTVLPASPLSYEGQILKIRWCVRVRVFLHGTEQVTHDQYFQLGNVRPFSQSALDQAIEDQKGADANQEDGQIDSVDNGSGTGAA